LSGKPKMLAYRGIYLLCGLILVALPLLPLQFSPERLATPELLFAFTFVWVVRQPDTAPFLLVALLALLADSVLMRPLGLWAFLFVIAIEITRYSYMGIQERGVLMELSLFVALLVAMSIIQSLLLWASFSQGLDLRTNTQFVMRTALVYPVMLLFIHYILRVRKPDHSNRPDRLGKIR